MEFLHLKKDDREGRDYIWCELRESNSRVEFGKLT